MLLSSVNADKFLIIILFILFLNVIISFFGLESSLTLKDTFLGSVFLSVFLVSICNYFSPSSLTVFNCCLSLTLVFSFFKSHSILSSFFNRLLKTVPNGEYSTLVCSTTHGLCPKSSSTKYSYMSNSSVGDAEILAASLFKSCCT